MMRIRKTHNHLQGLRCQMEPKVAHGALEDHLVGEAGLMIATEVVDPDQALLLIHQGLGIIPVLTEDSLEARVPVLVNHTLFD